MGKKKIRHNKIVNWSTFNHYYNLIELMYINRYEWENLPDSVDMRYLELGLFRKGRMLYFNDEVLGDLCLEMSGDGDISVYREPKKRYAYSAGSGGYTVQRNMNNSVIIYDNFLRKNNINSAIFFAQRLAEITRTADVNLHVQKTPYIICCDEAQKLTMQNLLKDVEENTERVFGYKGLDVSAINALKLDAPFIADKLSVEKMKIWNECLTWMGINNSNTEKRERMVTAEANSNTECIDFMMQVGLNARIEGVRKINKMFGTDIAVRPSKAIAQMYRIAQYDSNLSGGVEDV